MPLRGPGKEGLQTCTARLSPQGLAPRGKLGLPAPSQLFCLFFFLGFLALKPAAQRLTVNPTPLFQGLTDRPKERTLEMCFSQKCGGFESQLCPLLAGRLKSKPFSLGPYFLIWKEERVGQDGPQGAAQSCFAWFECIHQASQCLPEHSA